MRKSNIQNRFLEVFKVVESYFQYFCQCCRFQKVFQKCFCQNCFCVALTRTGFLCEGVAIKDLSVENLGVIDVKGYFFFRHMTKIEELSWQSGQSLGLPYRRSPGSSPWPGQQRPLGKALYPHCLVFRRRTLRPSGSRVQERNTLCT